jgi:signal transduction histidine kinase
MRERLALLDGKLDVESTAGGGTTLVAEVPWR